MTLPYDAWKPLFYGTSAGLLALGLAPAVAALTLPLHRNLVSAKAQVELSRVPDVGLLTDAKGRVLAANERAGAADMVGPNVAHALAHVCVDPNVVADRLLSRLRQSLFAEESFGSAQHGTYVSVSRLSRRTFLWSISARMIDPTLAVLTVKQGTVFPNGPAEAMLGRGGRALEDVVRNGPIRQGGLHDLCAADGSMFRARLIEIGSHARGRDIAILSPDALALASGPTGQSALSAPDLLSVLPVPMLKVNEAGRLLEVNREARAVLAIDEETLPPLFELVEGMGRPIADWLSDAANGRGLLKPEIVRAVIPGQELFLQITLGRSVENGQTILVGILNDATELKTLEAQFVQSQKMQAIGQLAGGVAHDFNNLLTAISGHCDLLLLRHETSDPEYADLIQISQNANRAASLVGQLLAFSRKQNLKPQALDLRDTMADLAHLLNRLIGERVQLDVTHAPGPQMIRADRRQLEQVIVNLVVNARDAMSEGGKIEVITRTEHLAEEISQDRARLAPGDYVVIEVRDTGCGIPPEALSKIFEPFFSTKKTGEGTGLGLSTAYGIVKQTGGFIFVESTVSVGTVFTLYFPATTIQHVAAPVIDKPRVISTVVHDDATVLLVEDEAPVRAFACRALRLRGYTVIEASDAEEALSILEDKAMRIDLFVTDVIMPGLDGPTWVRQALKDRPNTRVVFMSGYAEEGRAEKQARIPNSIFLPKPFSLHQLTTVVHDQLLAAEEI
ncbi:MAG: ATP-binding protein [Pseudomonadota bacterium]